MFDNLPKRRGDDYFDELDKQIKENKDLLTLIVSKASYPIIVSGGFGDAIKSLGVNPALHVKGGLRKSRTLDLSQYKSSIEGKTFTFIDDSLYKGRTLNKINKEIIRLGGHINQVIVGYDDTCELPFVESIYNRTMVNMTK